MAIALENAHRMKTKKRKQFDRFGAGAKQLLFELAGLVHVCARRLWRALGLALSCLDERRLGLPHDEQAQWNAYLGVTSNLARRIWEHREGVIDGFMKTYDLKRLVWYERYDDIRLAIQRERTMKHWPRNWKLALIVEMNPDWVDLYEQLNA